MGQVPGPRSTPATTLADLRERLITTRDHIASIGPDAFANSANVHLTPPWLNGKSMRAEPYLIQVAFPNFSASPSPWPGRSSSTSASPSRSTSSSALFHFRTDRPSTERTRECIRAATYGPSSSLSGRLKSGRSNQLVTTIESSTTSTSLN